MNINGKLVSRAHKANRHLGVICRRQKYYKSAETYYKKAIKIAAKLDDEQQIGETLGGTQYALANLYYLRGDINKALQYINESITNLDQIKDEVRLNLSLIKKADIQILLGNYGEAKDLYRSSCRRVEKMSHRLQTLRWFFGIGEAIY